MCIPYESCSPYGSGMSETGFAMCSSNPKSFIPSGIFLNPSRSSEYAINSDLYPKFSSASLTPYALTASPKLPMWGIPDAPRPLSTLKTSVFLPSDFSLSSSSCASLSIQVPLPMTSCSDISSTLLPCMAHITNTLTSGSTPLSQLH